MKYLLLPFLLGCAAPPPAFEERVVDTIPEAVQGRSWRFSRDGRVAAYVLRSAPEQDRVVVRRVAGKPLNLI
jgi:hypothetical protein